MASQGHLKPAPFPARNRTNPGRDRVAGNVAFGSLPLSRPGTLKRSVRRQVALVLQITQGKHHRHESIGHVQIVGRFLPGVGILSLHSTKFLGQDRDHQTWVFRVWANEVPVPSIMPYAHGDGRAPLSLRGTWVTHAAVEDRGTACLTAFLQSNGDANAAQDPSPLLPHCDSGVDKAAGARPVDAAPLLDRRTRKREPSGKSTGSQVSATWRQAGFATPYCGTIDGVGTGLRIIIDTGRQDMVHNALAIASVKDPTGHLSFWCSIQQGYPSSTTERSGRPERSPSSPAPQAAGSWITPLRDHGPELAAYPDCSNWLVPPVFGWLACTAVSMRGIWRAHQLGHRHGHRRTGDEVRAVVQAPDDVGEQAIKIWRRLGISGSAAIPAPCPTPPGIRCFQPRPCK